MTWWQYAKALFKGKKIVEEAMTQEQTVADALRKSSWRSTEFITALLTGLAAVAAQAAGVIPPPYGSLVATASGAFYALARGLAKNADPMGGVKPGPTTTEFLGTLLPQIAAVAAAAAQTVKPETAAILCTISNGVYGLSRGLAKGGAQPDMSQFPPTGPSPQDLEGT